MRANGILQRLLPAGIHKFRRRALLAAADALVRGARASVTGLGRTLRTTAKMKHAIKRMDRLVGNSHLHREVDSIFQAVAARLLAHTRQPTILVDYTEIPGGFVALVAAVAGRGRASTVLCEVYPKAKLGNARCQQKFLKRLSLVLPEGCRPVVVTDAGFYARWFDDVTSLGWDYVGRVRNRSKLSLDDRRSWIGRAELLRDVGGRVRELGALWLNKNKPSLHRFVAIKKKALARSAPSRGRGTPQKKCRTRADEPWLLATSLACHAGCVIDIYACRMQVEETFRDAKNSRWGFHLEQARCRSVERWRVILLLCTLAALVTTLAGLAAEARGLHRHYQANTIRRRRVLSLFLLGQLVLNRNDLHLDPSQLAAMAPEIPLSARPP